MPEHRDGNWSQDAIIHVAGIHMLWRSLGRVDPGFGALGDERRGRERLGWTDAAGRQMITSAFTRHVPRP